MARLNWSRHRVADLGEVESGVRSENRFAAWESRQAIREAKAPPPIETYESPDLWPVMVTVPGGSGGIAVRTFQTRHEADEAGFAWVGKLRVVGR